MRFYRFTILSEVVIKRKKKNCFLSVYIVRARETERGSKCNNSCLLLTYNVGRQIDSYTKYAFLSVYGVTEFRTRDMFIFSMKSSGS